LFEGYEYGQKNHPTLLQERQKIVLSQPAEENKGSKLEDFRKQIVGLGKNEPLLDDSSKRYVNIKDVGLTLLGRHCIMNGKAEPKDDHGETHLP
jgi:hypothetical protein